MSAAFNHLDFATAIERFEAKNERKRRKGKSYYLVLDKQKMEEKYKDLFKREKGTNG